MAVHRTGRFRSGGRHRTGRGGALRGGDRGGASFPPASTPKHALFATLPPEWPATDLRARIRKDTQLSGQRVVVLDDDPAGTQTVHSLPVWTEWTIDALASAWEEAGTTFYILTNSCRYPLIPLG